MGKRISFGVAVTMVAIVAMSLAMALRYLPAAESDAAAQQPQPAKQVGPQSLGVEVVVEEVDYSARTITARATVHVVPPHEDVGGQVFLTGTTDARQDEATKFVRMPVMPEANLEKTKPNPGLHAILRLKMLRQGALVVVGIEPYTKAERIGLESLDAPGTTPNQ